MASAPAGGVTRTGGGVTRTGILAWALAAATALLLWPRPGVGVTRSPVGPRPLAFGESAE